MNYSRRLMRVVLATAAYSLGSEPTTEAAVFQGAAVEVSGQLDEASVFGVTSAEITQDILASVANQQPSLHGNVQASIGRFGAVGIELSAFGGTLGGDPNQLFAKVIIGSDEFVNHTGVTQQVIAHAIIDGGRLDLSQGAANIQMSYLLQVGKVDLGIAPAGTIGGLTAELAAEFAALGVGDLAIGNHVGHERGGTLTADAPGQFSFTPLNGGLSATFDPAGIVDIPISLESFDLGVLPAGHRMMVGYVFTLRLQPLNPAEPSFVEIGIGEYSDPLNLAMNRFVTIEFAPVPEPTSIVPEVASVMIWSLLTFSALLRRAPRVACS